MSRNTNGRKNRKPIQRYIDRDFARLLDKIKKMRIMLGKDEPKNIKSDWRITLAFVRHPQIKLIYEDILNAELD